MLLSQIVIQNIYRQLPTAFVQVILIKVNYLMRDATKVLRIKADFVVVVVPERKVE